MNDAKSERHRRGHRYIDTDATKNNSAATSRRVSATRGPRPAATNSPTPFAALARANAFVRHLEPSSSMVGQSKRAGARVHARSVRSNDRRCRLLGIDESGDPVARPLRRCVRNVVRCWIHRPGTPSAPLMRGARSGQKALVVCGHDVDPPKGRRQGQATISGRDVNRFSAWRGPPCASNACGRRSGANGR
jgi:hypothetical protein